MPITSLRKSSGIEGRPVQARIAGLHILDDQLGGDGREGQPMISEARRVYQALRVGAAEHGPSVGSGGAQHAAGREQREVSEGGREVKRLVEELGQAARGHAPIEADRLERPGDEDATVGQR